MDACNSERLFDDVMWAFTRVEWRKPANHVGGEGLVGGVNMHVTMQSWKRFLGRPTHALA